MNQTFIFTGAQKLADYREFLHGSKLAVKWNLLKGHFTSLPTLIDSTGTAIQ